MTALNYDLLLRSVYSARPKACASESSPSCLENGGLAVVSRSRDRVCRPAAGPLPGLGYREKQSNIDFFLNLVRSHSYISTSVSNLLSETGHVIFMFHTPQMHRAVAAKSVFAMKP